MTEADKIKLKQAAEYLAKALQAIEELSPDGGHELANVIMADCESILGDLESFTYNLNALAK